MYRPARLKGLPLPEIYLAVLLMVTESLTWARGLGLDYKLHSFVQDRLVLGPRGGLTHTIACYDFIVTKIHLEPKLEELY